MRLLDVSLKQNKSTIKLLGRILFKGDQFEIFFEYPKRYQDLLYLSADPFFPALLIPAMMADDELVIDPPLSEKLFNNSNHLQNFFCNWYPKDFNKIEVKPAKLTNDIKVPENDKSACFFSMGVDSFFTLLKNNSSDLKNIIYMEGLELPLSRYKHEQAQNVVSKIMEVEKQYDVELIHGKTNLRDHFDLDWPKYYHGAGLAATALSLSNSFSKVYIASSHSYKAHIPVGSSFMIDHLWSTENTDIVHDGAETGRSKKVSELIVNDKFALDRIRVCTENNGGDFNCCKCRKCIMTMINLDIVGKLDECNAFAQKSYPTNLKILYPTTLSSYALLKDLYEFSLEHGKKDIAKRIDKELRMATHDLYGRKEIQISLSKYILYFFQYLTRKILR